MEGLELGPWAQRVYFHWKTTTTLKYWQEHLKRAWRTSTHLAIASNWLASLFGQSLLGTTVYCLYVPINDRLYPQMRPEVAG